MNNWGQYYKCTLDNIINNINIYKQMIYYYYEIIIKNKLKDEEYIKKNYNLNVKYALFKKYILEQKNLGIFTIFNNIPDIIHPLEDDLYFNYGAYLSFIKPSKFNIDKKNNIIVQNKNIFKFKNYKYPFIYQDIASYNIDKTYMYINIKYFNFNNYTSYAVLFITSDLKIYSYNKNIFKIKNQNHWNIIDKKMSDFNNNIIYVSILRSINEKDITNTFNSFYKIEKNTKIYSYNKNKTNNPVWFSLYDWEFLNDPYKIWYNENDILYQDVGLVIKNIKSINLSIDILSNNKITKTTDITKFLNNPLNVKNKNTIFNGNLNYIKYKSDTNNIWKDNRGKKLLNEIFFKSSNFNLLNKYYFSFLSNYNINSIINSYGYYEKLDKFYTYELGFYDNPYTNLIKIIETNKIKYK